MIDQKLVENIRNHGSGKDFGEGRRRVLEDVGFRMDRQAEYVIITGCFNPEGMPHVFRALKELLEHLRIDYTVLAREYCCGWVPLGQPAVMSKNAEDIARSKELSRGFVRENFRQAEALGAKSIALFCAACEPAYTNCAGDTGLEIISYSELLNRYFTGGSLDLAVDYYAGCYRFRRRLTDRPIDLEPAVEALSKIEGLRVNHLDNSLCCYIGPHLDKLVGSLSSKTLVTICAGCHGNLVNKLRGMGDYQVRMLPEVLWEAVQNREHQR